MLLRGMGLLCMALVLAACANRDIYSGDVYSGSQAKTVQTVTYGTIVSVRPVKIQAKDEAIIGTLGGAALGGIAASTIGGGRGRGLATVAGAIAGGVIGKSVEEKVDQIDALELEIRKDNGEHIVVVQKTDPSLQAGRRVRMVQSGNKVNVGVMN